jgi:hypothetical protein
MTYTNNGAGVGVGSGEARLERVMFQGSYVAGDARLVWVEIGRWTMSLATPYVPQGTPTVVRNSPETVSVKFACNNSSNIESVYLTMSLDRGQSFVRWSGAIQFLAIEELSSPPFTALTGGVRATTAQPDDYVWVFATDEPFTTAGTVCTINEASVAERSWVFGSGDQSGSPETEAGPQDMINQWWYAAATTQRFVAL